MFELSGSDGFRTVRAFILYEDTLAFMVRPEKSSEKLGIMRLEGILSLMKVYWNL
ncbi:hypothetical protein [Ruminiclostridium josui]|uniref:hypothetical protein n=1 Tax=Ruminiclostridium josui TaxID=1499 RepID=UPI0004B37199|nr:hypothetical protein [Ruminiclostridium josui]